MRAGIASGQHGRYGAWVRSTASGWLERPAKRGDAELCVELALALDGEGQVATGELGSHPIGVANEGLLRIAVRGGADGPRIVALERVAL